MDTIEFNDDRSEYYFLSPTYPSPFTIDGNRYRTLYQYIHNGGDLYEGLIHKYRSNPTLAVMLRDTDGNTLSYTGTDRLMNGIDTMSMDIRDTIVRDTVSNTDNDIIFDNLYTILYGQGYRIITSMDDIPIQDGPRDDYSDLRIKGIDPITGKDIEAIVDVYIDKQYTDDRMKQVIGKKLKENVTYFVVTTLSKQTMNKFLRVAAFNNVRLFTPSELFTSPSRHMLTPNIEKVLPNDEVYNLLRSMEGKLAELSHDDRLAKEKGFTYRDIVRIDDFSPHYRIIV